MKSRRHFTLIELLTAIGIIAILIGILVPTINKVKDKAKVTKAKTEVKAIETALKLYEQTYGYLPFTATAVAEAALSLADYSTLITWLQGSNPRGLRMLEVDNDQGQGVMRDPWEAYYRVALDTDYDGDIDNTTTGPYKVVYTSVAVWSIGKDGTNHQGDPDDDDVPSWE